MRAAAIDRFPILMPWIGGDYQTRQLRLRAGDIFSGSNYAVHVLGESHYSDDYEISPDITKRVVATWAFERQAGAAFFTKVLQAIQGRPADEVDRVSGWSDISFSNYIQDVLGASRTAPDDVQWGAADRCFVGQLAITKPRVLLVLGARLWDRLTPDFGEKLSSMVAPNGQVLDDAWVYPFWDRNQLHVTIAVWSYHPSSSRFDWKSAHSKVVAADMLYDNISINVHEAFSGVTPTAREPDFPSLSSAIG